MADALPTGRELEALKMLWQRGKATVREIYQDLKPSHGEGELAYTTVLSLLQTMEQKGLVGHEPAGKAYLYFAVAQRDTHFGISQAASLIKCLMGPWASTWPGPCNRAGHPWQNSNKSKR